MTRYALIHIVLEEFATNIYGIHVQVFNIIT